MKILLKGGVLITMCPQRRVISDSFVRIENGLITGVGKGSAAPSTKTFDEVYDATDQLIIPGLIDAHSHLFQGLYKGLGDGVRLIEWLDDMIAPLGRVISEEQCASAAALTCIQMIKSGTTTLAASEFIHSKNSYVDACAEVVERSGMRAVLARASRDIQPTPAGLEESPLEAVANYESFHEKWNGRNNGLIVTCPSALTVFECSRDMIKALRELADRCHTGFHMHTASTPETLDCVRKREHMREVELLAEIGALKRDSLLAHVVAVSEEEIQILADTATNVVHLPYSNSYLGYGVCEVPRMRKLGIKVAIGCDTTACGGNFDMIEAMRMAALMQRNHHLDPTVMTACDVLEMATIDGAHALGLSDSVGSIEEGKRADITILDLRSQNATPNLDPVANLVYSMNGSDVKTVLIDGKFVMRNRQLHTFDEMEELSAAGMAAKRAVEEANVQNLSRQRGWRYE